MRITLRGLIQLIAILLRLATMQGAHSELKWDFSKSGEDFQWKKSSLRRIHSPTVNQ